MNRRQTLLSAAAAVTTPLEEAAALFEIERTTPYTPDDRPYVVEHRAGWYRVRITKPDLYFDASGFSKLVKLSTAIEETVLHITEGLVFRRLHLSSELADKCGYAETACYPDKSDIGIKDGFVELHTFGDSRYESLLPVIHHDKKNICEYHIASLSRQQFAERHDGNTFLTYP